MFLYFLDVYFTYSLQLFICILYIMTDNAILPMRRDEIHFTPSNIYPEDIESGRENYLINIPNHNKNYSNYRKYINLKKSWLKENNSKNMYNPHENYKEKITKFLHATLGGKAKNKKAKKSTKNRKTKNKKAKNKKAKRRTKRRTKN